MYLDIIGETSLLPGRGEDPSEVHPGHQDHRQVTPGNSIQHLQLLPQEMELPLQNHLLKYPNENYFHLFPSVSSTPIVNEGGKEGHLHDGSKDDHHNLVIYS